ncbi:MAG: DoxX family membrane protein [Xanthobacteraceae bacterium]
MNGFYATDASWLDTAGRLLMVAFFLIVGIRNLQRVHVDDHLKRLAMFHAPFPAFTFWFGLALEFVSCALVLLDWHAAWGVIGLIVFTVLATALLLRFWDAPNPGMRAGMQNGFLANIGVLGGLLLLLQDVRW